MRRHLWRAWLVGGLLALLAAPAAAGDAGPAGPGGDHATALAAWLTLAEAGDAGAQRRVGEMLRDRQGVRWRDFELAAAWFRRAAAQGEAEAQYALGRLHYEGFLIPRDGGEMRAALEAAARQGHARARLTLGVVHEYGCEDIAADLVEALKWYALAGRSGGAEVAARLAALEPRVRAKMTGEEIATALALAAAWQPAAP
jgi:hypothetical protein